MTLKLDVPQYNIPEGGYCGPVSLRMVISFLDEDPGLEEISKRLDKPEGAGVFPIQLAKVAASMGYETEFYTRDIDRGSADLNRKYQMALSRMDHNLQGLVDKAKDAGVDITERSYTRRKEVLSYVTDESLPIVLLNWGKIEGERSFGHYVPVVGYDQGEEVYIHNPALYDPDESDPFKFKPIEVETFEKARKARGTNEELIVVSS